MKPGVAQDAFLIGAQWRLSAIAPMVGYYVALPKRCYLKREITYIRKPINNLDAKGY